MRVAVLAVSLASLLPGVLGGCKSEVEGSWRLRFQSPATAQAALTVAVSIRRGSCLEPGDSVHADRFFVAERGVTPPSLEEGHYNLWAEARTAGCIPIARGCVDVDLPDGAEVELMLIDERMPMFDAVATQECEEWLARRRVLGGEVVTPADPPGDDPIGATDDPVAGAAGGSDVGAPTVDAGMDPGEQDAGMVSAMDAGVPDAGDALGGAADAGATQQFDPAEAEPAAPPSESGLSCEESCPPCTGQWRCCNEMQVCGCTVVPNLCWANIEAAIPPPP